jgi:LL-H family phage holin
MEMDNMIFTIINFVLVVSIMIITKYIVPLIKEKLGVEKLAVAEKWAKYAVLTAQQTLQSSTGVEKKAYVTEFLKELLTAKNISLTDEQINILIESAVKTMKMEEN